MSADTRGGLSALILYVLRYVAHSSEYILLFTPRESNYMVIGIMVSLYTD